MVLIVRTKANNKIVFVIKPFAFFMTFRKLKSLLTPKPLDFLMIDAPPFYAQKLGDFAIAIAAILFGKTNESQPECIIIVLVNNTILHR